jgi:alkylation response protein AidB-like acyl-CoA dehydrogenase
VIAGELITAVGITEPWAGSDVAGIRTSARREGDHWVLNGTKMFITNGVHADLYFVAAKTGPASATCRFSSWRRARRVSASAARSRRPAG